MQKGDFNYLSNQLNSFFKTMAIYMRLPSFLQILSLTLPFYLVITACGKSAGVNGADPAPPQKDSTPVVTTPPVDPVTAGTIGFFMDGWTAKSFTVPSFVKDTSFTLKPDVTVNIQSQQILTKISPYLFGNNTNLWMGQIVTEPVLMGYLRDLAIPVLRGPGGSISDFYFWNQKDAAPLDAPAQLLNADGVPSASGYWYGGNTNSFTLTLDHYNQALSQIGSTGMLTVNYAYARYGTGPHPVQQAAHLAADWVRYDKGKTKYWEVGNEDNGNWEAGYRIDKSHNQDGQPEMITGELYGMHFKVFADSMRAAASEVGSKIYIGAQLLEAPAASWATQTDKSWNQGVLQQAGASADFFIVHDYFTPYNTNSSADDILNTGTTVPAAVMDYLKAQFSAYGVPEKPVALTEWNIRATGAGQNVSFIAGLHAVLTIGQLITQHFGEASRWDLANGWDNGDDHGLFNNGDEPGGVAKWNPRPAFYYLYFLQKVLGDRLVDNTVTGSSDIVCYSSSFQGGGLGIALINTGSVLHQVNITTKDFVPGANYYWYDLRGGTDNGDFSRRVFVNGKGPESVAGGPAGYASLPAYKASTTSGITVELNPKVACFIQIPVKK